jgi:hypothetical protein
VLAIASDRLYWAVLVMPPSTRQSGDEALRYAFEPHLPAPLHEIVARFTPLLGTMSAGRGGTKRWLACGIEHARLGELITDAESGRAACDASESVRVESVIPAALPDALGALDLRGVDLRTLEFRSGLFESPRRARRRATLAWSALGAAACASALLTAGLLIGAGAHRQIAREAHASARTLAANALQMARGDDPGTAGIALPASVDPRLALGAQLRRAEQSRLAQSAALGLGSDRTEALLSILSRWPGEPASRVDELRLDQGSVTIRGQVREAGDAERLAAILASDAWSIGAVQASRAAQGYAMSIVLRELPPQAASRDVRIAPLASAVDTRNTP